MLAACKSIRCPINNNWWFEIEKNKIVQELWKLDKKILIIIDDLDRVKFDDFIETLRIINISRDFPNIIFILSFDYENINKFDITFKDRFLNFDNKDFHIREDIDNSRIIKYLEKIIDIKYLLTIDIEEVKSFFITKLNEVFKDYYYDKEPRKEIDRVVNELYDNKNFRLYGNYLSNLRSLKKIINTININLAKIPYEGIFTKINLNEYIKLILLYLYHPKLFNEIYTETNLHWYTSSVFYKNNILSSQLDKEKDGILNKYLLTKNDIEKSIIKNLFISNQWRGLDYSIEYKNSVSKENTNTKRVIAFITNDIITLNQIKNEADIDLNYNKLLDKEITLTKYLEKLESYTDHSKTYTFNKLDKALLLKDFSINIDELVNNYKDYNRNDYLVLDNFIQLFYKVIIKNENDVDKYILKKSWSKFVDILNFLFNEDDSIYKNILKEESLIYMYLILDFRQYFREWKVNAEWTKRIDKIVKELFEKTFFREDSSFNLLRELYIHKNDEYWKYFIYFIYQLWVELWIENFDIYIKALISNLWWWVEDLEIKKYFKEQVINYYNNKHENSWIMKVQELFSEDYIKSL